MLALLAAGLLATAPTAEEIEFEGVHFDVIRVDLDDATIQVRWVGDSHRPLRTFRAMQAFLGGRAFALTNAGIFDEGELPTGVLVSNGIERRPLNTRDGDGNFYLKPNGVFVIDAAGAQVVEVSEYPPLAPKAVQATQSGPLLLRHGKIHPVFNPHSQNRVVRSGVGVADPRHVVLAISEGPVDFHTFARLFLERLKCDDALYLDGVISRLHAPSLGLDNLDAGPFAGILAVVPKAAPATH